MRKSPVHARRVAGKTGSYKKRKNLTT